MCRFTFYLGRPIRLGQLITDPTHSLIRQSFKARERKEPLNGDGFGIAWYAPRVAEEPAAFRSLTPAWNNRNLLDLARVVESPCILAHVRAATQQLQVSESNCHPFTHGRFSFMHNGDVGGFARIKRRLIASLSDHAFQAIHGSTDSEHVFALFLDEIERRTEPEPVDAMAGALRAAVARVLELVDGGAAGHPSYLNFVVSDGAAAVACRCTTDRPENATTLYFNEGRRYVCDDGVCHMLESDSGEGAVLVSSEPISEDKGWRAVPVNHLVKVRAGFPVCVEKF